MIDEDFVVIRFFEFKKGTLDSFDIFKQHVTRSKQEN